MLSSQPIKVLLLGTLLLCVNTISAQTADKPKLNSKFYYIHEGKIVDGWSLSVGDPANWSTPVIDRKGKSASGKVAVEPSDFKVKNDALTITWNSRSDEKGTLAIYGADIDLSTAENTAALVIDMKIEVSPNKEVNIGMGCTYPCEGMVNMGKPLKKLEKDKWQSLPIPLNCLTKAGLDLKKINGPIIISTEGRMKLSITSIHLEKLQEGDASCAEK
jgi:hypothetical protein